MFKLINFKSFRIFWLHVNTDLQKRFQFELHRLKFYRMNTTDIVMQTPLCVQGDVIISLRYLKPET